MNKESLQAVGAELLAPGNVAPKRYTVQTFKVKLVAAEDIKTTPRQKMFLSTPRAVADMFRAFIAEAEPDVEHFAALFLNVQNEVLAVKMVNSGTVDQVAVYPRVIIRDALLIGAAGLILAHNHPSGYTEPSEEDRRLTDLIRTTARALDIRVLDHMVINSRGGYTSFAEKGLI